MLLHKTCYRYILQSHRPNTHGEIKSDCKGNDHRTEGDMESPRDRLNNALLTLILSVNEIDDTAVERY